MDKISLLGKDFQTFISSDEIDQITSKIASSIENDFKGQEILFIAVLNGAFIFASDVIRKIKQPCSISFIKCSSYSGTTSSGSVKNLIGLDEDITGKTIVLLEDIIDTGLTVSFIINELKNKGAHKIKIASLLFKPECCKTNLKIDYLGREIPDRFVIGYGMDFNALGRNLESIYIQI